MDAMIDFSTVMHRFIFPGSSRKRWYFVVFLIISGYRLFSQATDVGKVESYIKIANGIAGKTENGWFRIEIYNAHVMRVRVSKKQKMNDFSYILTEIKPATEQYTLIENGNSIFIETDAIRAEIERHPSFRVIFRNRAGKVINEDMPGKGFGTVFSGTHSNLYKKLQPDERFVGLGETLGNLDKRGNAFTLNNTDTYKYGDPRLPMYVSIPFYIGIHSQEVYGLFYHNTWKTFFNFGISTPDFTSITTEGGDVDYFLIYDSSIAKILEHYTALTGRMTLPPKWSLGYHQSRCSYFPQDNVLLLAETFRRKNIPIDCIVLDADYLQDYEPFRINTNRFPDMKGLTSRLKNLGIEVTASVNPGIKLDSTYFGFRDGLKNDVFVKYADGSIYTAEIAPSLNHFVDFTHPKARKWWADHMKFLPENGIHGYWNDMNEPAVGGSYLPENLVFDFDGHKAYAPEAKNLYGMLMARSSFESALKYGNGRRPFVLTRSGFAGVQRYAAVWTGDNTAKDEYLLGGALLNTQLGLSGLPFVGDDIGGYIGTTSKELFTRWIETGVFEPFVRNHKEAYANANEPWSYGEEAEAIAKEYIGFRYKLMPYLYSLFFESTQTGIPVVRSLCIANPFDNKVFNNLYQYQFMLGNAIMVVPVTSHENVKKHYLPEGEWYDLYSDEKVIGNKELSRECGIYEIPLYIRSSSIIPMQSLVQSTKEIPSDTLYIHIYNGSLSGTFTWYDDEGDGFGYQDDKFSRRTFVFDPQKKQIKINKAEGSYKPVYNTIQCIFHGFDFLPVDLKTDTKTFQTGKLSAPLLDGLRYLEAIYDPAYYKSLRQKQHPSSHQCISFPYSGEEINITW